MLDELQLRNYAQNTIRHYVRTVEDFARRFHCSPDRLGPRHVREYQAELFRKGKSPGTVTRHLAALRFFYVKTLRRAWSIADTPYPKKTHRLPTILSREEVAQLIHAARTPCARTLLMTLYATGARNSELTHLKISDIDSQRMVVHTRGGKGRKDRDVMLSPRLLTALRTHWRFYHRKSSTWLFPSNYRKDRPIDTKTVWHACHKAAKRADLQKRVHPHTLRHSGSARACRFERHPDLRAPGYTAPQRHRESSGLAIHQRQAHRREIDEPAASGGGRYHLRRGRGFHRTKPPLAPLEACQGAASH